MSSCGVRACMIDLITANVCTPCIPRAWTGARLRPGAKNISDARELAARIKGRHSLQHTGYGWPAANASTDVRTPTLRGLACSRVHDQFATPMFFLRPQERK